MSVVDSKFADLDTYQNLCTIKVVGVGGAGNNAVDHMLEVGISGVEFWVANTDVQMLSKSKSNNRIILGETITKGLGAGANPTVGREAALESEEKIKEALNKICECNFDINPKILKGKNEGCKFCEFKECCFVTHDDYFYLDDHKEDEEIYETAGDSYGN